MFKVFISKATEGLLFSILATEVSIPTEEEEITILDFHQPIIARLKSGVIRIDHKRKFTITDGIAYFNNNELKMVVETK